MNIGADIRKLRKEQQCTQAQLSKMCGWTQSQMARIEASPTQLTVTTLVRVASALGLKLKVVFENDGEYESVRRDDIGVNGIALKEPVIKRSKRSRVDEASLRYWERLGIAL
jgi:transcriptional regulator with XRE-family HTH domain